MANIQNTAIVTRGSQGIGAGLVKAFLDRGYNVVANSRNITKANPFPPSVNLALVDGDIGDPKMAAQIVDTAVSRFGRIDVLINNAGVFIPKPFLCWRISLVEYVISQRKKDRMTVDACRDLNNMRVVADNQIGPLLNQPVGLRPLPPVRQFLILIAPVNRDHDQVRSLLGSTQFLGQFG